MNATEGWPRDKAAGVVKAQQMDSKTGKALQVTGGRVFPVGERSDFWVQRGRCWTERCRQECELKVFNTDGER